MATKTCKLVFSSATENSNKIYVVEMEANGSVYGSYGRIGAKLVRAHRGNGEAVYTATINEKLRKGYTELKVASATSAPATTSKSLEQIALSQIHHTDPEVTELIKFLVEQNKHHIEMHSGGNIKVDTTGVVRTVTGDILTSAAVTAAITLLNELHDLWTANPQSPKFYETLGRYLMLIPQQVGRNEWDSIFTDIRSFQRQRAFLDQLLGSAELCEQKGTATAIDAEDSSVDKAPLIFDTTIASVDIKDIAASFERSKCTIHKGVADYKVVKAYRVHIKSQYEKFQTYSGSLPNHAMYWHGTMSGNILSILRAGYIVPPESANHVTGRMFGPGVYFSDQSTKSLNYSAGLWCGSSKPKRVFLLLNQVALGNYYCPKEPTSAPPPTTYHSYYVAGGTAGVLNNEMIIPRTDQAYITHLIELGY